MQPVKIGSATIYHAESVELLKDRPLPIGAIVSDPPYGTEEIVGGYSRAGGTIANDRNLDTVEEVLFRARPMLPKGGWAALFYSPRIAAHFYETVLCAGYQFQAQLVWDKKMPGMGNPLRYSHEGISLFTAGEPWAKLNERTGSVLRAPRIAEEHPHQKPEGLMRELCHLVPVPDGLAIFDPFMGSGSTGVACARLGIPFIGIELAEEHFITARKRIEAAVGAPDLFGSF